jgi:hypothetical protein
MIRADWNKRRLQRQETELYRIALAESAGTNLVSAILSGTPAAKLLTRVQRQILTFERAWYRANAEILRARREAEATESEAFETFLDRACAVTEEVGSSSLLEPTILLPSISDGHGADAEIAA